MRVARDPDVQIVVELIGGTGAAKDFLLEAVRNGKSVVTANKALLAECGPEIMQGGPAAGVDIGFEASVGGGIPIIRTLREGLAANRIQGDLRDHQRDLQLHPLPHDEGGEAVRRGARGSAGSRARRGRPVVRRRRHRHRAQARDPGLARHRRARPPEGHLRRGDPGRSRQEDIAFAKEFGYTIKLLAIAKENGAGIEARVHPTMIPSHYLLATVDGAYNAIYVKGDFVGSVHVVRAGRRDAPHGVRGRERRDRDRAEPSAGMRRAGYRPSGFSLVDPKMITGGSRRSTRCTASIT